MKCLAVLITDWQRDRWPAEPGKAMLWEYTKPADTYPGANTPDTQVIETRGSRYIFETPDHYYQRAQLADKIRKAVLSQ